VRRRRYWMAARNWALSKVRSTSPHSPTGKSARTGCC
jgi:hypothetical protein